MSLYKLDLSETIRDCFKLPETLKRSLRKILERGVKTEAMICSTLVNSMMQYGTKYSNKKIISHVYSVNPTYTFHLCVHLGNVLSFKLVKKHL